VDAVSSETTPSVLRCRPVEEEPLLVAGRAGANRDRSPRAGRITSKSPALRHRRFFAGGPEVWRIGGAILYDGDAAHDVVKHVVGIERDDERCRWRDQFFSGSVPDQKRSERPGYFVGHAEHQGAQAHSLNDASGWLEDADPH